MMGFVLLNKQSFASQERENVFPLSQRNSKFNPAAFSDLRGQAAVSAQLLHAF